MENIILGDGKCFINNCSKFNPPPRLDMGKWGDWMLRRNHTSRMDSAYNTNDCECKGILSAAIDGGSMITWDDNDEVVWCKPGWPKNLLT